MKTVVDDVETLNCSFCFLPLKPPIFECDEGHALCTSCHDKLSPSGKCQECGTGFRRCRAMERLVESIRVACPNAARGCAAMPVYSDWQDHFRACPHTPCHCPGEACSFAGTIKELVDHHFTEKHGWPCTTKITLSDKTRVRLHDSFNFLLVDDHGSATSTTATGLQFLILLNVARLPLVGRAITVFCIHPHQAYLRHGAEAMKCVLTCYSRQLHKDKFFLCSHFLQSDLRVTCTDLSNVLPSVKECLKFVVPNSALGDEDKEAISVDISISIATGPIV